MTLRSTMGNEGRSTTGNEGRGAALSFRKFEIPNVLFRVQNLERGRLFVPKTYFQSEGQLIIWPLSKRCSEYLGAQENCLTWAHHSKVNSMSLSPPFCTFFSACLAISWFSDHIIICTCRILPPGKVLLLHIYSYFSVSYPSFKQNVYHSNCKNKH